MKKLNDNLPSKKVIVAKFLGLSSDLRTNTWEITCPHCGKVFIPQTTMRRSQSFSCSSCLGECYVEDYDKF